MREPVTGRSGLVDRAVSASGWRFGTVAVQLVLQLGVLAVLSRLLPPADFGVLGIAMIFVNLATVVSDLGAGAALIQRRELSPQHIRAAVTLSFGIGLLLAGVMAIGAPWWAALFRSERAEPVLKLLSVSFFLSASGLVPGALLWRRMQVKRFGAAEVLGYLAGYGATGIVLALRGHGVWSLAWAVIVQSGVRAILLHRFARLTPMPGFSLSALRQVLGFGLGLSLTKLFNFAATKGDYVVVGRWLGSEALGLYERAYRLMEMPATYFAGVVSRVLFPTLSGIQDDRDRLQRAFATTLSAVFLVYGPAAAALAIAAPDLIQALFGDRWTGAVIPLQILSCGLLFRSGHKICDAVIQAKGAVYRSAWRVFLYAVAVVVGAWVGRLWGLGGVALGVTAAIGFRYAMVLRLATALLELDRRRLLWCHVPGLVLGSGIGAILGLAKGLSGRAGLGSWSTLAVLGAAAVVATLVGLAVTPRRWISEDLRGLLFRIVRRLPGMESLAERWYTGRPDGGSEG